MNTLSRAALSIMVSFGALAAALIVTACSSGPHHRSGISATTACEHRLNSAQRFTLRRQTYLPPGFAQRFSFPAKITVTSQESVASVARAFCGLPVQPKNVSAACDKSVTYFVDFSTKSRKLVTISLDTGCDAVSVPGGNQDRLWKPSSPIWAILGRAAGVRNPTFATFRGPRAHQA